MRTCLASGDVHGVVSMYQYPVHKGAARRVFGGHAGPVTRVAFTFDDMYLISIGEDATILQFRVVL